MILNEVIQGADGVARYQAQQGSILIRGVYENICRIRIVTLQLQKVSTSDR